MAGTDFICSGFGSIPAYDNSFNASLFNAEEIEDFLAVQRDFMVDGGIAWPGEDAIREARQRAVAAMAAVLRGLDLADPTARPCASVVDADGSRQTARSDEPKSELPLLMSTPSPAFSLKKQQQPIIYIK